MPTYKLTYFDIKGLGDPIRMILTYLGRDFEDNRLKMDSWLDIKPTIKWGRVPVLDIDGKRYYQAQAIMRMLAKEANLAGDNAQEAYEIDYIVGTIADFISMKILVHSLTTVLNRIYKHKVYVTHSNTSGYFVQGVTKLRSVTAYIKVWEITDPKERADFIDDVKKKHIPYYMQQYDEIAGANGGYLANSKLSWADLFFHGWVETLETIVGWEFVNDYPNMKLGRQKVYATPGIKDWIARRPLGL